MTAVTWIIFLLITFSAYAFSMDKFFNQITKKFSSNLFKNYEISINPNFVAVTLVGFLIEKNQYLSPFYRVWIQKIQFSKAIFWPLGGPSNVKYYSRKVLVCLLSSPVRCLHIGNECTTLTTLLRHRGLFLNKSKDLKRRPG
jgi:hypothetical protein